MNAVVKLIKKIAQWLHWNSVLEIVLGAKRTPKDLSTILTDNDQINNLVLKKSGLFLILISFREKPHSLIQYSKKRKQKR